MPSIVVDDLMYISNVKNIGVFQLPTMTRVSVIDVARVSYFAANRNVLYACLDSGEVLNLTTQVRFGMIEGTVTAFAAIDGAVVYGRKQEYAYWVGVMDEHGCRETCMPDVVYAIGGDRKKYAVGCDQRVVVYENGVDIFTLELDKAVVCICLKDERLILGTAVPKQPYMACCLVNLEDNTVSYPMYGTPDRIIAVACDRDTVAYSTQRKTTVIRDETIEIPMYSNNIFLMRNCIVSESDSHIRVHRTKCDRMCVPYA